MIPTYNQSDSILKALQSALAQSYRPIEIIISDDSTDNLTHQQLLPLLSENIRYYRNTPSLGRVNNYRHMLYNLSRGQWILNLDGDDYLYDSTFIEKAIALTQTYNDLAFVFAKQYRCQVGTENLIPGEPPIALPETLDGNRLFLDSIFKNVEIPHLCALYNRAKALDTGFYRFNIISSDRESLLKLAAGNRVGFVNCFAGVWMQHADSASQQVSLDALHQNAAMYPRLQHYAAATKNFNPVTLMLWSLLGQYKLYYLGIGRLISGQNASSVINTLFNLLRKAPLMLPLLGIDPRNYLRLITALRKRKVT